MQEACQVESLREWFKENRRDFPWREKKTPYRVWISEVMLQQTVASVVVAYFERWMERFPTLEALAEAHIDEVIKHWEGLGYYSRARNLHKAAQIIHLEHGGVIPQEKELLERLPGFGPYTTGALLSFAFGKKAAAIDGNVRRVISRYFALETVSGADVESFLPDVKPWEIMEALIELGATVCRPKPTCQLCPLQDGCLAYRDGRIADFPPKTKRPPITKIRRDVSVVLHNDEIFLKKGLKGEIMEGLYEFPYVPLPLNMQKIVELPVVSHTFTRFHATLYPVLYRIETKVDIPGFEWVSFEKAKTYPFSSGHRRIFKELLNVYSTYREFE
jgi:A/G-specific adenine glycosylase